MEEKEISKVSHNELIFRADKSKSDVALLINLANYLGDLKNVF